MRGSGYFLLFSFPFDVDMEVVDAGGASDGAR
jgi:hypothetical protein